MNDLTKEELNDLDYYLEHFLPTICNDDLEQKLIDLHYKIQSMIDNYCEHEFNLSNKAHFECRLCGVKDK